MNPSDVKGPFTLWLFIWKVRPFLALFLHATLAGIIFVMIFGSWEDRAMIASGALVGILLASCTK